MKFRSKSFVKSLMSKFRKENFKIKLRYEMTDSKFSMQKYYYEILDVECWKLSYHLLIAIFSGKYYQIIDITSLKVCRIVQIPEDVV